jgi:hypothetical protein
MNFRNFNSECYEHPIKEKGTFVNRLVGYVAALLSLLSCSKVGVAETEFDYDIRITKPQADETIGLVYFKINNELMPIDKEFPISIRYTKLIGSFSCETTGAEKESLLVEIAANNEKSPGFKKVIYGSTVTEIHLIGEVVYVENSKTRHTRRRARRQ